MSLLMLTLLVLLDNFSPPPSDSWKALCDLAPASASLVLPEGSRGVTTYVLDLTWLIGPREVNYIERRAASGP